MFSFGRERKKEEVNVCEKTKKEKPGRILLAKCKVRVFRLRFWASTSQLRCCAVYCFEALFKTAQVWRNRELSNLFHCRLHCELWLIRVMVVNMTLSCSQHQNYRWERTWSSWCADTTAVQVTIFSPPNRIVKCCRSRQTVTNDRFNKIMILTRNL